MRGKDIPLTTWYRIEKNGVSSFKQPAYTLTTTEAIKAEQDRLGDNAQWYYGMNCEKCCGVYPKFMTDGTFADLGYFVCLVCGKEGQHEHMEWQAREAWNAHKYKWVPDGIAEYEQMTIFDFLEGGQS